MEYFPDRKGLVTGIIVGSYGLGSFIFNLVATKIVNPTGASADIRTPDPNLTLFHPSVANRVPLLLRILCMVWLCLVLIAASLISKPRPDVHANMYGAKENKKDGLKYDIPSNEKLNHNQLESTKTPGALEQQQQNGTTIQPQSSASSSAAVSVVEPSGHPWEIQ